MEAVATAIIFAPFSWVYRALSRLHRMITKTHRLGFPVISVGNIAMGGRAKTPFVIYLCQKLKSAGFAPVVLTRGYGRVSKTSFEWQNGAVSDPKIMGDEAVEIARSGSVEAVLVGANRVKNAQDFLFKQKQSRPWVFVLDDGFQHWALHRDVDIVIVNDHDLKNRVVPWGELRETPKALERATLVLHLGRDLNKETIFSVSTSEIRKPLVLTTRASQRDYVKKMRSQFLGSEIAALKDHASRDEIITALIRFKGADVILGDKEAVKVLTEDEYLLWKNNGFLSKQFASHTKKLYRAQLILQLKNEHQILGKINDILRKPIEVTHD
jgi:tetraacyldisaccharide-1-P 4'-kinase